MLILIAGPYRSGTNDDPIRMAANLHRLEAAALPLFRAGHLPRHRRVAGPAAVAAGGLDTTGRCSLRGNFYPVAHRLLEKCEAVLRLEGASAGADG
ncbi:MAG: DUF4406 domain-containing protein [Hymenobacter sp.]